jgi:hypothetical protein
MMRRAALPLAACLLASAVQAQPMPTTTLPDTIVVGTSPSDALAASEQNVTPEEIAARPITRPGEIVEAAPGLIATQHSGEGKANQYFLRGLNLDHGTDLALTLDGMPLNMRTHAHGQGYADLNFLIPEVLGGLLVRKGPYAADLGDFATAGALGITLANTLPRPILQVTGGSFGYWRGLAAGSFALGPGNLLLAGEVTRYDGPWQRGDDLRRLNGVARYSQGSAAEGFSLTAMATSARWTSTDQIPSRAVPLIGRYGTLDPSDGGQSQRFSLSGGWHREGEHGFTRVNAYAVRSSLDLYNNFTYFQDDLARGDQFHQRDRRWLLGLNASHTMEGEVFGRALQTRVGLQTRYDDIQLGLYRTQDRAWLSTVRADQVQEGSVGLWTDATLRVTDWLRTIIGLRGDWVGGRVRSDLAANSGTAGQLLASPKAGLVLGPWHATELFLNAGTGFHSNDLRGATITLDPNDPLTRLSRVPLLVRAKGAELGLRTRWTEQAESSLAFFVLTLGSEIVFVGDAGTTEASRPSRRVGVEWTNRWQMLPWLGLDADLAVTQARFTSADPAGNRIPGAPNMVAAAGVVLGDQGPGWFGAARLRFFGARPLIEDNSARSKPTTIANIRGGYRFENGITARLDVLNLFGARASQIDYFYASQLRGEVGRLLDRHFHPIEPVAVRFTVTIPL